MAKPVPHIALPDNITYYAAMPEDARAADRRPDPDALIALAAAEHRGRLKIFLGAAPGVGKTWEMLAQAKRQQAQGVNVVAGVVETHGRAGTIAALEGLPELKLRSIPYRGQILQEFDLEAALARRPGLLLVDELAHTNAPGSRHAKRWEDVADLVKAGLTVWATLNVQHLESLNDDIARITGVRVSETLPDRVMEMADEIELIDLPPAELRARLVDGQIYRPDNAKRALEGFFKEGNLASLREMALRRAAAHVDEDVRSWMARSGVTGPWPSSERVLALVGPDPSAEAVVRQAKRLADALHAPWTVLHVERANSMVVARSAMVLASQLGATVDMRVGADLVGTALDVAQQTHATHLVLGRGRAPLWRRLTGQTLSATLMRQAQDLTLHVIPRAGPRVKRVIRVPGVEPWWAWPLAAAGLGGITFAGVLAHGAVPGEAMGMVYVAAIVAGSSAFGMRVALAMAATSFLTWDFFFLPPLYQFTIGSPADVIALVVFAFVAVLAGGLAGKVRGEAQAAQARIEGLRRVGAFSRSLGQAATEPELLVEIARQAAGTTGRAVVLAPATSGADIDICAAEPAADTLDEAAWAAARWAWVHHEAAGQGTSTLPSARWRFLPLGTVRTQLGVLGVRVEGTFDEPAAQAVAALADQAAIAWERVLLAQQGARTQAMEETQALRTALLASLGHDLRTPLTGIQGAAGTLRAMWDKLTEETRIDLLDSIDEDVGRMAGFLANITELTRLENGQINPRLGPVSLDDVIDSASARVPRGLHLAVQLPEPAPVVLADAALLEQVLVNVLENAVKYSPAGSLVRVRATLEGETACIAVADEGVGIPPDDLSHVFDSFFRAQRGDRVVPGTGLGLAIARGMTEAMAGRIDAHSPRPEMPADGLPGTVITIRLPLYQGPTT
jgi:two-component system, OmpR family, sensor histidine kinase KdpD